MTQFNQASAMCRPETGHEHMSTQALSAHNSLSAADFHLILYNAYS
jgi:hypothetical protein